jgi:hypothetical protein
MRENSKIPNINANKTGSTRANSVKVCACHHPLGRVGRLSVYFVTFRIGGKTIEGDHFPDPSGSHTIEIHPDKSLLNYSAIPT